VGFGWSLFSIQSSPLLELRLPLEYYPTKPSRPQPANSSHGLLFPSAHEESQVHFARASQPATFRLQGLATLLTGYSLRSLAGFVSHRQRSWDLPFGGFPSRKASGVLPPESTHIPFNLAVFPPPKRRAGPIDLGFWASTSRKSLATRQGFSSLTAGSSLGFHPSRVLKRTP
jgi:hypothetical protein